MQQNQEVRKVKRSRIGKKEVQEIAAENKIKVIPKNIGRPKRFTPTKLRNRINEYFAHCSKEQSYPNVGGLMLYIGMSKDQFWQYKKYPEFTHIISWAQEAMADWAMTDLWRTQTSNTNKQLVAKVAHGWTEEKQVTHVHMSKDQAMAKLEALAPLLLEALKNQLNNPEIQKVIEDKTIEGEVA